MCKSLNSKHKVKIFDNFVFNMTESKYWIHLKKQNVVSREYMY
jgi:hypothetical protein